MKRTFYLAASAALVLLASAFVYKVMLKGVDIASMDKKADPRNDFYQYANGTWCLKNPVPAAEPRWTSFNILAEKNTEMLRKILADAERDLKAPAGSNRQKIGTFYRVAMDTVKLEAGGTGPLVLDLQRINSITDKDQMLMVLADLHRRGMNAFFSFEVVQDIKKSDSYIAWLQQAGLGLPDRDYYVKDDEKSQKIREAYRIYVKDMFNLYNLTPDPGVNYGDVIMRIETELARASMTRAERRDKEKQYNKRDLAQLRQLCPEINWDMYFNGIHAMGKPLHEMIVAQPEFFATVNRILLTESLADIKAYLTWKLINGTSGYVSQKIGTRSFEFYGKTLTGTKEQKPRWKRVVASANSLIGEVLAQEYVKVAFSEDSKKRVNIMVDHLREAFQIRISKLDWMSEATKAKANEKLAAFNRKLGYPDEWKDYSQLQVINDSYLANYYRAQEFAFDDMLNKLGKPVDRKEWHMLPQTVNAYYNAVMNEIVFPAAIMQPPFFDPAADDAVNYGAIGAVIGHEFSHGFDDQGSKYDAQGNLNEWWTPEDRAKFQEKTRVLVGQYNAFMVEDKVNVNGELTLGENIADFAGLTLAYDAYQLSLKDKPREVIDGFTPEQRLFLGFAQVWKNNARPEYLRQQVITDPHSPGRFRVMGPLSNMPAFYSAFGIKPGDKMYRDEAVRANIW